MPKEKKLNTKQELLSSMLEESLTRSEFESLAVKLAEIVKNVKDNNLKEIDSIKKAIDTYSGTISSSSEAKFASLKNETDKLVRNHTDMSEKTISAKIKELDEKLSTVKNGNDADEEKIVGKVLELITIPTIEEIKDDLPIMGTEVRDSLELLKEDERLDISAIKGLKELIKKLTPAPATGGVNFGAVNIRMVDEESLVGTKNGVNKVFTISKAPSPATSLKIYRNGQRMRITAGDFTYANKKITFTTALESDEDVYADYRIT